MLHQTPSDYSPVKKVRLADRFDSLIIAVQLLFVARLLILASGYSTQSVLSWLIRLTDPLAHALYALFPPIELGKYVIEPASAGLMVGLSILLALVSVAVDHWRLAKKEQARQPIPIDSY